MRGGDKEQLGASLTSVDACTVELVFVDYVGVRDVLIRWFNTGIVIVWFWGSNMAA